MWERGRSGRSKEPGLVEELVSIDDCQEFGSLDLWNPRGSKCIGGDKPMLFEERNTRRMLTYPDAGVRGVLAGPGHLRIR